MNTPYQQKLTYIFNRPTTEPEWYWENDDVENDDAMSSFLFLETFLLNPASDLKPYSDEQIGLGLNYIFSNACSNILHDFKAEKVVFERKINVINNLFNIFEGVLNPRTPKVLSAFSQEKLSKISYISYMFWDVSPLSTAYGFGFLEAEESIFYKNITNVMKRCLDLSNPACVESALHGLGHLAFSKPDIVVPIIDYFLKKAKKYDKNLVDYANMARTGMIQ